VRVTQEVTFDDVFSLVNACLSHGHTPTFLDVTVSGWHELAREVYPMPRAGGHFHIDPEFECGDYNCEAYRRALRVKPGDEPGSLAGVPVRIIADPPPPIVAVHENEVILHGHG
jgi:hypothetical protein